MSADREADQGHNLKEEDMQRAYVPLRRAIAGAVTIAAAFAIGGLPTSAQMTSTSPSASTATSTSTSTARKVPRTATPEMISDAIERSKSRTDRFKATGVPEQFGSEDPTRFIAK